MTEDEKTYTVTFKGCTIEMCGVYAETPEEAKEAASEDLEDLRHQLPAMTIWTESYKAEEE